MAVTRPLSTSATPFGVSALSPRAEAARARGSQLIQQLAGAEPLPPLPRTPRFGAFIPAPRAPLAETTYGNLSAEEVAEFYQKETLSRAAYESRVAYARAAENATASAAKAPWIPGRGISVKRSAEIAAEGNAARAASGTAVAEGATVAPLAAAEANGVAQAATGIEGAAADSVSRFAPLKSLLAYQPAFGGVANVAVEGPGLGASAAGQWLGPGSLGRAGAYGLAGLAGKAVVNSITGQQDGSWDDALGGAAAGAGIGAGIGSVVPIVGTGIGAGVGALAGGAIGWLTGDDSPKTETERYLKGQTTSLASLMSRYGLNTQTQRDLLAQFGILGSQATSKDEAKAIYGQVVGQLPTIMAAEQTERQRAGAIAATQGWLMPMMQQQMDASDRYAAESAAATGAAAKYLDDPTLKAIYSKQAGDLQLQNSQQNVNYLALMQATPALYGYGAASGNAAAVGPYNAGPTLESILSAQRVG